MADHDGLGRRTESAEERAAREELWSSPPGDYFIDPVTGEFEERPGVPKDAERRRRAMAMYRAWQHWHKTGDESELEKLGH